MGEDVEQTDDGKHRLAGMALANGVMVLGPSSWAAAVRTRDGVLHRARGRRPVYDRAHSRRGLRGPVRLAEMLAVLPAVRRALPQSRFAFETPAIAAGMIGSSLLPLALKARFGGGLPVRLVGGAVSLAALLSSLRQGQVAQYHGAEHKAIGGYEQDVDAAQAPREHERCGTHLALPLMVTSTLAAELAEVLPVPKQAARLAGSGAALAATTEFARYLQRNSSSRFAQACSRVGMSMQTHGSTREPSTEQLEVASAALEELLAAEKEASAIPLRPE